MPDTTVVLRYCSAQLGVGIGTTSALVLVWFLLHQARHAPVTARFHFRLAARMKEIVSSARLLVRRQERSRRGYGAMDVIKSPTASPDVKHSLSSGIGAATGEREGDWRLGDGSHQLADPRTAVTHAFHCSYDAAYISVMQLPPTGDFDVNNVADFGGAVATCVGMLLSLRCGGYHATVSSQRQRYSRCRTGARAMPGVKSRSFRHARTATA